MKPPQNGANKKTRRGKYPSENAQNMTGKPQELRRKENGNDSQKCCNQENSTLPSMKQARAATMQITHQVYIIGPVFTVWGVLMVIGILSVWRLLYDGPEGTDVGGLIPLLLPAELFATAFNDV